MRKIFLIVIPVLSPLFMMAKAFATDWSYVGIIDDQTQWGDLSPAWTACSNGTYQSPVNIINTKKADLPKLEFNYGETEVTLKNDRYTAAITPLDSQTLHEGETTYRLKEMLIRTPSEHILGTQYYPLELQLVQEDEYDQLTIYSVFVQKGEPNKALQQILDNLPAKAQVTKTRIDWSLLIPKDQNYYAYEGSLPYPPCTQGLDIRVMKTPIEGSPSQVHELVQHFVRNARTTQPTFTRTIYESTN